MALVSSRGRPPAPSPLPSHVRHQSVPDLSSSPASAQQLHGLMLIQRLKREANPPAPSSPKAGSPNSSQPGSPRAGHVAPPQIVARLPKTSSFNNPGTGPASPGYTPGGSPMPMSPKGGGIPHSRSVPRGPHHRHHASWQQPDSPGPFSPTGGRSRLGRQQSLGVRGGFRDVMVGPEGHPQSPRMQARQAASQCNSPARLPGAQAPQRLQKASSCAQEEAAIWSNQSPADRLPQQASPNVAAQLPCDVRAPSRLAPLSLDSCQDDDGDVLLALPPSPEDAETEQGPQACTGVFPPQPRAAFARLALPPSPVGVGAPYPRSPALRAMNRTGSYQEHAGLPTAAFTPRGQSAFTPRGQSWDLTLGMPQVCHAASPRMRHAASADRDMLPLDHLDNELECPRGPMQPLAPRVAPSPRRVPPGVLSVPASPASKGIRRVPSRLSNDEGEGSGKGGKGALRVYHDLDDKPAPSPKGVGSMLGVGLERLNRRLGLSDSKKASTAAVITSEHGDISQTYALGRVLGKGQFGVIRLAENKWTGQQLACKTISKASLRCKGDVEDVRREHSILKLLQAQPEVCHIQDTFEDSEDVHFVMELCDGGDLFDRVKERKRYTEANAARVMRTVLGVLEFCHNRNIVHRDIKPENVLLVSRESDTDVKVIDFGIATQIKPGAKPLADLMGSLAYMAPEVLKGSYGCEADIWSAGALLYVLLIGGPPFWADSEAGLVRAIKDDNIRFSRSRPISEGAEDFVLALMTRDPERRLTATQALRHPWMRRMLGE